MDHDVLHVRIVGFNVLVHMLSDCMRIDQGDVTVDRDLQVHIDLVAELPCVKQVDLLHTGLLQNETAELLLEIFTAGSIQHFRDCVLDNVIRDLQDQDADDQTGNRIHERETQLGQADTDERAYGRDGV